MRRAFRFSIAGLLVVILVAAIGLAALRSHSATWAGGFYLLTYGVLILALVGAACCGASERAWWLGFALFGFGYLSRAFWNGYATPKLPTTALLDVIKPVGFRPLGGGFGPPMDDPLSYYWVVGHCLWGLLAATIGGGLAHTLFATSAGSVADRDTGPPREGRPARARWRRFAAVGLAGLVTLAALFRVGSRSDPALWAGAVYLLTWVLLGIAALGFACGHGKRRMIYFGAALFGLGYMGLNNSPDRYEEFSYGHVIVDQFLIELRPWLPPVVGGFPAETAAAATANALIRRALGQPVPMRFRDPTPLEDVLEYVRAATRSADGRALPVYVDPVGLVEAEKTMGSPIEINLEGIPLSTTLRLALDQLGMNYYVRDGLVHITSASYENGPIPIDYYLLLGHCVLALLAAGLGAFLVPLVSDRAAGQPA